MIRSVEFDLHTKSPLNGSQGVSMGARRAFATYKEEQRAAVRAALQSAWGAPPGRYFFDAASGLTIQNRWDVTFTRIAIGQMDPGALGGAFKAVQDELAAWCGEKDERKPPWGSWRYEQEKPTKDRFGETSAHVYRVRVEVSDRAPGQDRVVVRAETASHGRAAASRVKREVKAAGTRHGVSVHQPEAAAAGASSAARQRAETAFGKLTGKPTALDLRDAYLAVLKGQPESEALVRSVQPKRPAADVKALADMRRDPGEERPARDLAACTSCGADVGEPCDTRFRGAMMYGVHRVRAVAAGLYASDYHVKKALTNGQRRIVPAAQAPLPLPPAVVAMPWEQTTCEACTGCKLDIESLMGDVKPCRFCAGRGGKGPLRRDARHDGEHAPSTVRYAVPPEHRARFGAAVTLTRRRTTLGKIGECWLYE